MARITIWELQQEIKSLNKHIKNEDDEFGKMLIVKSGLADQIIQLKKESSYYQRCYENENHLHMKTRNQSAILRDQRNKALDEIVSIKAKQITAEQIQEQNRNMKKELK